MTSTLGRQALLALSIPAVLAGCAIPATRTVIAGPDALPTT